MRPDEDTREQEPPPQPDHGPGDGKGGPSVAGEQAHPAADDAGAAALSTLEAENASLKDRLLRALADAENVRRRAERDAGDIRQYAISDFARDMVNVADNLERALASIPAGVRDEVGSVRSLVEGVELTEKELKRSLERHGVKKFDPAGERFDPNLHEAMFEVADPSRPAGTVAQVMSPGYTIGGRSLRSAKVGVVGGGGSS